MRKPDYQRDGITLYCGDCLEILPELSGVDAVVTDPPYGTKNNCDYTRFSADNERTRPCGKVAFTRRLWVTMFLSIRCRSLITKT